MALTACSFGSGKALDRACEDNRSRAFVAAEVVRQQAEMGEPSSARARQQMAVYIAEVRRVPDCFAEKIRKQVADADAALKDGRVLDLGPRPPGKQ